MKNKRAAASEMLWQLIMIIIMVLVIILFITVSTASGNTWEDKIKDFGAFLGWG